VEISSWVALALLIGAALFLALVTAAEVSVASTNRARLQALTGKGMSRAQTLAQYFKENHTVYSSLSIARNVSLVATTALVVYLVLNEFGLEWVALAVTFVAALVGLAVVQAAARLVVSSSPQRWAGHLWPFVVVVRAIFRVPSVLLDRAVAAVLRWRRPEAVDEPSAHDAEDLLRLVEMEESAGLIDEDEREMIRGIMGLEDTCAREIMVPRIDIVAVPSDSSFEDVARVIVERGFSRVPIFEETIDNIIGVVHARELLGSLANSDQPSDVKAVARPAYFVPESKKVDELLTEMRGNKLSIAIVVDEYGGTAGLVTIEDLVEEIVGEITDEFDTEVEMIHRVNDTEAILDARVSIDALQELFGVPVEEGDFDTVGGFIFNHLGRMPSVGEELHVDGLVLRVLSVSGRRIKRVRVSKTDAPPATEPPPEPENGGNGPK
jgi:putative hemolysin